MNPLDYLRAMTSRRRYGPLGEPTEADIARVAPLVERALERTTSEDTIELHVDNSESRFTPAPTAVIEVTAALTRQEAQQLRAAITVTARKTPTDSKYCGCWPRYSYCDHSS